jgi:hypothetical protein
MRQHFADCNYCLRLKSLKTFWIRVENMSVSLGRPDQANNPNRMLITGSALVGRLPMVLN